MKRQTKAQRERKQKAALMQRVLDICSGAAGSRMHKDDMIFPDIISRIMCAVRDLWVDGDESKHLVGFWVVDQYSSPESICDLLWRNGVRA